MGIFSYTPQRPGRGISKNEPRLIRPLLFFQLFFRNIWGFIKISILFTITCIPIITIGGAVSGLTYISKCHAKELHVFLLSDYFEYFRANWQKGLAMVLLNAATAYSLYLMFINYGAIESFKAMLIPICLGAVIVIMMDFYFFPMLITYDIPLSGLLKNSFIFAMARLPLNLIITAIIGGILYALIRFVPGYFPLIIAVLILPSLINFMATFYVLPSIEKNMEGADLVVTKASKRKRPHLKNSKKNSKRR